MLIQHYYNTHTISSVAYIANFFEKEANFDAGGLIYFLKYVTLPSSKFLDIDIRDASVLC